MQTVKTNKSGIKWAHEEFIVTLDLYFNTKSSERDKKNPKFIEMAQLLNRTPASMVYRLGNYAFVDPDSGQKGFSQGGKKVSEYFYQYRNKQKQLNKLAKIIINELKRSDGERGYGQEEHTDTIDFPKLELTPYKEYDHYAINVRSVVVYKFLFNGYTTRQLDDKVLRLDSSRTKGWSSFKILAYMGVKKVHKGLFEKKTIDEAIETLYRMDDDAHLLIKHLEYYRSNPDYSVIDREVFDNSFEKQLMKSQKLKQSQRLKRIEEANTVPEKVKVLSITYKRNADLVAEVLIRADGMCESCEYPAPFKRAKDNTPYLEIHHVVPLSEYGEDSIDNTIAVCPNCHRKLHFGKKDDK